jgi:hypothetical protein
MRILALLIALVPAAAGAAPGTQLLRAVEQGLRDYRVDADVSQLTTPQAAAIYLTVNSPDGDIVASDSRARQEILSILRWNDATNPDLQ